MNETQSTTSRNKSVRRELAIVLFVAAAIRFLMLFFFAANLEQDPDAYRSLAQGLRNSGVYGLAQSDSELTQPTAYRPPLYPIVLSCLEGYGPTTVRLIALLHLILGVVTVLNTWLLADSWGIQKHRWLPAILVACDPLLLNQSTFVMTETMAALMTTLCLIALGRWNQNPKSVNSIAVGISFALAMLCRPTFLAWFALAGVLAIANHLKSVRTLLQISLTVLVFAIAVSPWIIRNQLVLYPPERQSPFDSRPVFATTHGGYTLLLGNNDSFYDSLVDKKSRTPWEAENTDFLHELWAVRLEARNDYLDLVDSSTARNQSSPLRTGSSEEIPPAHLEPHVDRQSYKKAIETIESRPLSFLDATAHRITWFWSPLGQQTADPEPTRSRLMRWSAAVWFIAIYFFMAVGIRYQRSLTRTTPGPADLLHDSSQNAKTDAGRPVHPWIYGILFCLALTLVHAFFWSNLRMRAPLIPIVSLVAGFGIEQGIQRIRAFRSLQSSVNDDC